MLEKLAGIEERYEELNQLLMGVGDDYQRAAELGVERAELEPIVTKARQYRESLARMDEARELLDVDDEELRLLAQGELDELEPDVVFSMYEKDTHQHHRRAARIGSSVGRKKYITSYIYDSGSAYDFHPNVFSLIDKLDKEMLIAQFISQIKRGTIQIDMIQKKWAYWASVVSEKGGYAEAFITKKLRYRT